MDVIFVILVNFFYGYGNILLIKLITENWEHSDKAKRELITVGAGKSQAANHKRENETVKLLPKLSNVKTSHTNFTN